MNDSRVSQPPVICLMGPTASGKTDLAVALVKQFPMEIISVDSAMVYRGMDIGTAKPPADLLAIAPHHLIDIRDPADTYSAADFANDANALITSIQSQNKIPLLVGGTFLYFQALIQGLSPLPQADPSVRDAIAARAASLGWPALHAELAVIDPVSAIRIKPTDPQRIQRALEVYALTGKSMSSFFESQPVRSPHAYRLFGLMPTDRQILHDRITQRFHHMLASGFMQEVERLYQRGDLQATDPSMRACGYRQAFAYLAGEIDYDTFVEKAIISTRQLAKRQMTWMRSMKEMSILMIDEGPPLEALFQQLASAGIK